MSGEFGYMFNNGGYGYFLLDEIADHHLRGNEDERPQHDVTKNVGGIVSVLADMAKAVAWLEACDTDEQGTAQTLIDLMPQLKAAIDTLEQSCKTTLKGEVSAE